jgi:hypothetical protein
VSDGSDNGNGDGEGAKDMAAHATTGERGMMVAMGHGLCVSFCVCGETTKNNVGPKKSQCDLELISLLGRRILNILSIHSFRFPKILYQFLTYIIM